MSLGPSRLPLPGAASFVRCVASDAASEALTASARATLRPATFTPPPSTFVAASTAAFAASGLTKSTNAVPFGRPEALSMTTRHDRTLPNFPMRSNSICLLHSVGTSRMKTLHPSAAASVFSANLGGGFSSSSGPESDPESESSALFRLFTASRRAAVSLALAILSALAASRASRLLACLTV